MKEFQYQWIAEAKTTQNPWYICARNAFVPASIDLKIERGKGEKKTKWIFMISLDIHEFF